MRYAQSENNQRIEVEFSGQRAKCGICKSVVIGKKGEYKKKHWAHKRNKDCDHWYEPITDWHLTWQNYFPEKNREKIITKNGKSHRADLQLDNKMVIEVQNSPINIENISSREEFYGENNMIWILNGETLAKYSEITIEEFPYQYYFIIDFPEKLPNNPDYLTEELYEQVMEFYGLHYLENVQFTSNKIICSSFHDDIAKRDQLELTQLKYHIVTAYEILYGHLDIEIFREKLQLYNGETREVDLKKYKVIKKYWRKFIDKMKFPVFIDQMKGLSKDEIFWYQKNKVYKKEELLKKYLVHAKTGNNNG